MAIFGLFVGINNYPIIAHRLKGCVADMTAFEAYIKGRAAQDKVAFSSTVLTDKAATRTGILAGFDVFAKAKDGDVCVFYYSGHGSCAPVPIYEGKPMFEESDGMTESIIAYDSRAPKGMDILDKELGFLIYKAMEGKKVHFLTVFDCCHAGGNTRNTFVAARARMAEPAAMPTDIKDVLGYATGYFTKNKQGYFEPKIERNYLSLAAARSNQTAKEVEMPDKQTRGAFTFTLLNVLQTQGANDSYAHIIEQVNLGIRNIVTDQNALAEATIGSKLEESAFLGGVLQGNTVRPRISFNADKEVWEVNQGSINGLGIRAILCIKNDATQVKISTLQSDTAVIAAEFSKKWDKKIVYEAEIIDLGTPKTLIIISKDSDAAGRKVLQDRLKKLPSLFFDITTNAALAQYEIRAKADSFSLLPFGKVQPMFRSVAGNGGFHLAQAQIFVNYIEKVLLHAKVCGLENPRSTIDANDIELEVFKIDATTFTPDTIKANIGDSTITWKKGLKGSAVPTAKPIVVQYFDDKVTPMFRLNIKNKSKKPYFIGAVMAYGDYTIGNEMLQNQVTQIDGGTNEWLKQGANQNDTLLLPLFRKTDHPSIKIGYPDYITEISVCVKIIISTNPFSIAQYTQSSLELEPEEVLRSKGFDIDSFENTPLNDGNWTVKTVNFIVQRKPLSQTLAAHKSLALQGISITSNSKILAKANLSTATSGTRDMGIAAPNLTDKGLSTFNLNAGFAGMPALNVLELHNIDAKAAQTVTKADPIILKLDTPLGANEAVIPIGYIETKDEKGNDVRWFYPLGGMVDKGKNVPRDTIQLNTLPDPITEGTRSFTGAIKVFFQKVVLQQTDNQMLREVCIKPDPEGGFVTEYIANSVEELATRVQKATNIVVFIHGIIGDTEIMVQTMKRIRIEKHYDLALAFDYESLDTHIPDTAKAFQNKLEAVGIDSSTSKNVHIISHSMGGLVSRYMLEKGKQPPKIGHLIQLGTPNNGSPWGDFQAMVQLFLPRLINTGGGALGIPPFVTKIIAFGAGVVFNHINNTLEDMQPGSPFMKELNDGKDSEVPMTIIAGNTSLLVQEKAFLARVFNQYTLLNNTLFNGNNDMAVTVQSILTIEGGTKRSSPPTLLPIIACDHISYFMNAASLKTLKKAVDDVFV